MCRVTDLQFILFLCRFQEIASQFESILESPFSVASDGMTVFSIIVLLFDNMTVLY